MENDKAAKPSVKKEKLLKNVHTWAGRVTQRVASMKP
jgi:hypothetical protein